MSELLRCPFCGNDVDASPEGDYWEITCEDCHLSVWAYDYEELVMIWNCREGRVKMNDRIERIMNNFIEGPLAFGVFIDKNAKEIKDNGTVDDIPHLIERIANLQMIIESLRGAARHFRDRLDIARGEIERQSTLLAEAQEEIKELEQSQGGWISVKDKMPEKKKHVFMCCAGDNPGEKYMAKGFYSDDGWYRVGYVICASKDIPTHWMPLPEPPKGAEGETSN